MPLTITEAMVDRGPVGKGVNESRKFDCSDGEQYVAKPHLDDKQFANELIAVAVGEALGIPIQPAALIEITQAFLQAAPGCAKYRPGKCFGSAIPRWCHHFSMDNPDPGLVVSMVQNVDALYPLVVFDDLVSNGDRGGNPANSLMLQVTTAPPRYEYRAIDHGHILTGPAWTVEGLRAAPVTCRVTVLPFLTTALTNRQKMREAGERARTLIAQYSDLIKTARSDLDDQAVDGVIEFLTKRGKEIPDWIDGGQYLAALPALTN